MREIRAAIALTGQGLVAGWAAASPLLPSAGARCDDSAPATAVPGSPGRPTQPEAVMAHYLIEVGYTPQSWNAQIDKPVRSSRCRLLIFMNGTG